MPRKSTWSTKEVKYLKQNWQDCTANAIASVLGRTPQQVYDKARLLKLKRKNIINRKGSLSLAERRARTLKDNVTKPKWTVSEVKFLQDNAGSLTDREISKILGKTIPAVYCKRRSLSKVQNLRPVPDKVVEKVKNKRFKPWSKEEEKFVKEKFNVLPTKDLARKLGRTEDAVKVRAYTLGLFPTSDERPRTKWTEEEITYIKKNINSKSYEEIGKHLGRSSAAIASKASALKISRSPLKKKKNVPFSTIAVLTSAILNIGLFSYIIYSFLR